jgi:hypothetical protein
MEYVCSGADTHTHTHTHLPLCLSSYVHPESAAIGVGFEKNTNQPCDCILNGRWRFPGTRPRYSCSSASDDDVSKEDCVLVNRVPLEAMISSRVLARGITIHDATLDMDDTPNVILDIDEDYFVTADPVGPLMQAGWNNMSLGLLDDVLMRLCVEDAVSEQWLAERIIDATYGRRTFAPGVKNRACSRLLSPSVSRPSLFSYVLFLFFSLEPRRRCPGQIHLPAQISRPPGSPRSRGKDSLDMAAHFLVPPLRFDVRMCSDCARSSCVRAHVRGLSPPSSLTQSLPRIAFPLPSRPFLSACHLYFAPPITPHTHLQNSLRGRSSTHSRHTAASWISSPRT